MGLDVRPCGPGLSGAAAPLDAWDDAPLLRLAAPVLCVAWEAAMFARVVFAGADPSLSAPSSQAALFVLMAVGCAALFLRYRLPVVSVLFESVVGLLASVMGALAYVYFLPLVALYACVARAPRREAAAGGVAAVATVALSAVVDGFAGASAPFSASLAMSLASIGYPLMLVLGAALLSRFRWQRLREAEAAARAEAERAAEVARAAEERDRALAKSRIAAELHDSVGHDLTAIVALSEGLAGATGDEQLDRAIASINELARSGLADTRRAVRALAGGEGSTAAPPASPGPAPAEKPAERPSGIAGTTRSPLFLGPSAPPASRLPSRRRAPGRTTPPRPASPSASAARASRTRCATPRGSRGSQSRWTTARMALPTSQSATMGPLARAPGTRAPAWASPACAKRSRNRAEPSLPARSARVAGASRLICRH